MASQGHMLYMCVVWYELLCLLFTQSLPTIVAGVHVYAFCPTVHLYYTEHETVVYYRVCPAVKSGSMTKLQ